MKYWEEYQSKWGFRDGDAVPPDAEMIRYIYVRELNRELAKRGSSVRLLAWDRGGMHNPYLILRIPAQMVADVPEEQLCRGRMNKGWEPEGEWEVAEPDRIYEDVVADAYDMDLDDLVEVDVRLREDAA